MGAWFSEYTPGSLGKKVGGPEVGRDRAAKTKMRGTPADPGLVFVDVSGENSDC